MRERLPRRVPSLALLCLLVSSTGCDEDRPSPERIDYELFDNTRQLDEATIEALDGPVEDPSTLTFSASTPLLEGLEEGNVLIGGATTATPSGLLRRVTAIDRSGGAVVVTTEPSTVFHAFRRLDVIVDRPLEGEEAPEWRSPPPPTGPGVFREPLTIEFPIGIEDRPIELFDGDSDSSTREDRVGGTGTLLASVRVRFWLTFDWGDLTYDEAVSALGDLLADLAGILTGDVPSLAELLHLETGLEVDGTFDVALDLVGKSALSYERERPLGGYPIGAITVGPLVFVPDVAVTARFEGGVTGEMTLDYGASAEAGLGFAYNANESSDPVPYVLDPSFSQQEPTATVTAAAQLRAELELSLRLALWGFMGPYVSLTAYSEIGVDRARSPCFELSAGFEGGCGASIGLAGRTLAAFNGPSFPIGDPMVLAQGECEPVPDPPPTAELIDPWSRSFGETVFSVGTDDGFTDLSLHHDGRLLLTSQGGEHLLKVEEDGTLTWARELSQPDRDDFPALWPEHATAMSDTGILVATHQNVLVKLDAGGEALWGAQIETDNAEPGFRAARLVGGDVWLAGTYRQEGSEDRQAWLLALDGHGEVRFSWTWGSPDHREVIRGILPLDDGALLVGEAASTEVGGTHGFVMRLGQDGSITWARQVLSCGDEEPVLATAFETGEGNFIVGGWHYATETRAILFRLAPDGSGDEPAWATETTIPQILGLEPRSIVQLPTGQLRVTGRWARTGGNDEVFVAATDSIGRFSWLRWYGGDGRQAPPTSRITAQGGLLVATTSSSVEESPGGFWLFEVPVPNGEIDFAAGSGATSETLEFTSTDACLSTPAAPTTTTPLTTELTSVGVEARPVTPEVHSQ